ncbi:MAG: hypothetical protein PHC57_06140, partial [Candidatus Cloacimonetes bacterium]|nr:hypothetical protein [Candidatus Cloacimonadota bacterium]
MVQIQNASLALDHETYDFIVEHLYRMVQNEFSHLNILDEVVNSILIRIIKMPLIEEDIKSAVTALYPKV